MTDIEIPEYVIIQVDSLVCPFCGTDTMHGGRDYDTGEGYYECSRGCGQDPRDGAYADDFTCDESGKHCLTKWVVNVGVINELSPIYRERAIEALIDAEDEARGAVV